MSNSPIIFLAGGGTGGHLYPGIAVAEALREAVPGCKAVFLCTQRQIDKVILEPTGFEFIPQPILPKPPVRIGSAGALLRFWKSWRDTKDVVRGLLHERKPAAVIGLGGYAAGAAVKLAASRRIPSIVLNPDVVPGQANLFLTRFVQAVCCQFEATAEYLGTTDRAKLHMTGCPIRADITHPNERQVAAANMGLNPKLNTLLVTGASLGALTVNEAVLAMLPDMTLRGWQILHLAGRDHAATVRAGYRELPVDVRVVDFTPDMADVWAVTDLAISRSGASSCAELTACGVPSILMPYPFHKDRHQRLNAEQLSGAGAAVIVDDQKDRRKNAATLRPVVESLLYDAERRKKMAAAARQIGKPGAARAVADVVVGEMGLKT